ncbi:hypothetical protein PybrP1_000587 [[Pythium] brassicae (nom. inval.)]|nr:hypothetical protein PybrP1_000587 [[Pythium] brassicae (nom. inval.)]
MRQGRGESDPIASSVGHQGEREKERERQLSSAQLLALVLRPRRLLAARVAAAALPTARDEREDARHRRAADERELLGGVQELEVAEHRDAIDAAREVCGDVDERYELIAVQARELVDVVGEQDLDGRAEPHGLDLAPEAALLARHAVHDAAHVLEPRAELHLERALLRRRVLLPARHAEERLLVKAREHRGPARGRARRCLRVLEHNLPQHLAHALVVRGVARRVVVLQQLLAVPPERAHDEEVREVEVLEPLTVLADAVHKQRRIRVPRVAVLVAQRDVRVDRGLEARDEPVVHALLQAHALEALLVPERRREAVFLVDRVPDALGLVAAVARVPLRVLEQVDVRHRLASLALVAPDLGALLLLPAAEALARDGVRAVDLRERVLLAGLLGARLARRLALGLLRRRLHALLGRRALALRRAVELVPCDRDLVRRALAYGAVHARAHAVVLPERALLAEVDLEEAEEREVRQLLQQRPEVPGHGAVHGLIVAARVPHAAAERGRLAHLALQVRDHLVRHERQRREAARPSAAARAPSTADGGAPSWAEERGQRVLAGTKIDRSGREMKDE